MISRAVLAAVLVFAFACATVHGKKIMGTSGSCKLAKANSKLGTYPEYPYNGNPFGFPNNYGIGTCSIHPWYGTGTCTDVLNPPNNPSYIRKGPVLDESDRVHMKCDMADKSAIGADGKPPQPIPKELLNISPFGPRMTDCNRCFVKFPEIRESCNAYRQWKKVQECVEDHRVHVIIPVKHGDTRFAGKKFYAKNKADQAFSCNEREIARAAATCLLRNTLSKRNPKNCMNDADCTNFMSSTFQKRGMNSWNDTVPNFGNLTINTVCPKVPNWFSNPPSCADADAMNELDKCLRNEATQSKWNEVAKGYVSAWYEEYYFRVCRGNDHHSKMVGSNFYHTAYYPDIFSFTEAEKEAITVKGLNFDKKGKKDKKDKEDS